MTFNLERALEAKGFKVVNLDDYDVWAYEINNG